MGEILGGLVQAEACLSQAFQGLPHPGSQPTTELTVLAARNTEEGKHCECLPFLFLLLPFLLLRCFAFGGRKEKKRTSSLTFQNFLAADQQNSLTVAML